MRHQNRLPIRTADDALSSLRRLGVPLLAVLGACSVGVPDVREGQRPCSGGLPYAVEVHSRRRVVFRGRDMDGRQQRRDLRLPEEGLKQDLAVHTEGAPEASIEDKVPPQGG